MAIDRIKALVKYLVDNGNDAKAEEMKLASYDKCLVQDGSREYLVLTDREADKRTAEYIKDSVWAFNADFIASHSKISYDATVKVVKALQEKCEGANEDITALIKSMPKFIADAIRADGRGHFLNHYDNNEDEVRVGSKTFYIYRQN
jgi:hypothetical protein